MPKYSFKCEKCGKDFTIKTSYEDKAKAQCPECGSKEIRQVFNSIGIIGGSGGCGSSSGGNCGFS